jgi:hypothetical protein
MRIPDRQKLRREYLKKKAGAVSKSLGFNLLLPCLMMATLVSAGLTMTSLFKFPYVQLYKLLVGEYSLLGDILLVVTYILLTFGFGYACWKMKHLVEHSEQQEAAIEFVPPVTPGTLPAEEVLVRGSEEPTQDQRTLLLRAADGSANGPADPRLRSTIPDGLSAVQTLFFTSRIP